MHINHCLAFIHLFMFCGAFHEVTSGAISSPDILRDELFSINAYEVLSVHEDGDEDVVHLRKRADKDGCQSDCLSYSGWEEDELMKPSHEDQAAEGSLSKRNARKNTRDVCKGVRIEKNSPTAAGIHLHSPTWETVDILIDTYSRVYDIGDPQKPDEKEWFQLRKRDKKWKVDLNGRAGERIYAAEHVLEWHLLKDFIEEDKELNEKSRCAHLYKWFLKSMPKGNIKVKVAKNDGELGKKDRSKNNEKLETKDRFTYEEKDYTLDKWEFAETPVPRLIEWITHQWPGKSDSKTPNPWQYELVILNSDANIKKENVWSDKNIFVVPQYNDKATKKTMLKNKQNSQTLEMLFENRYYEKKKLLDWPDNKGKCKAVYRFMTVMSIAQYHNDLYVREVLRAQVNRIGEAWDHIERNILAGTKHASTQELYKKRDLKTEWLDFMTARHKKYMKKMNDMMDEKIKVFTDPPGSIVFPTKVKRWDYLGVFRRAKDGPPNCGFEPDPQKMQDRVAMMIDAYKNMPKAVEDLKLN
ncbi:hypothetical protein HBI88_049860 [Parastagonospora nodorum]|nr:hypothetical protein HBI97_062450 [Parastagonospora nodorum]KAH5801763.1 hypothetical protein HBI94_208720 [Parastagonospora nodorum]KAH5817778.1 hypothetical protein HBI96_060010 [Parastagonospora nodorum]KAH5838648.1 hypothetical protein HBI93_059100 [Parastagonospora nodorum]KAH5873244.1 hypothetical protein HBI91_068270 [Parastagonospora nodorum]